MATFRVGQRVRFVNALHPENENKEAKIIALDVNVTRLDGSCRVGHEIDRLNRFGNTIVARENQLEPILYDGNKTVEWSECLWQPDHVREAEHIRQQLELKEVV